jgi:hypothetical protein
LVTVAVGLGLSVGSPGSQVLVGRSQTMSQIMGRREVTVAVAVGQTAWPGYLVTLGMRLIVSAGVLYFV